MNTAIHLNEDHVHEVKGRESDGKIEPPGQGSLSHPKIHFLLETISPRFLNQPDCHHTRIVTVAINDCQDQVRVTSTKISICRHSPQPSLLSSKHKYWMLASSIKPANSLHNFSCPSLQQSGIPTASTSCPQLPLTMVPYFHPISTPWMEKSLASVAAAAGMALLLEERPNSR